MDRRVELERPRAGLAVLRLNRPGARNAIDSEMLRCLHARWSELEDDGSMRVVLVAGSQDVFAAGGDIKEMVALRPEDAREFVELGQAVLGRIERSRLVSVGVLQGVALGGGAELALACDIRVAAAGLRIGFPEVRVGLLPGWGGTQRLLRQVGKGAAALMILSGRRLEAAEAQRYGLVDVVAAEDEVWGAAERLAGEILAASPTAVRYAKAALVRGRETSLSAGLALEVDNWLLNFSHPDRVEGLSAFVERRDPTWR